MRQAKQFVLMALCVTSIVSFAATEKGASTKANLSKDESVSNTGLFTAYIPEAFFNYFDFKFDSNSAGNFNRYDGHSRQYGIAGNAFSLSQLGAVGVYLYRVDSKVNSQMLLAPGPLTTQNQDIKNDVVMVRLLKLIGFLTFDASAGYGRIKADNRVLFPATGVTGYGSSSNNNWFASLTALFIKNYAKHYVSGNARVIYTNVKSGNYRLSYGPFGDSFFIAPNTTKATWIQENLEAGYHINELLTPFIHGGLIQVADFSNSRNLITSPIVGAIPQLNNNKSGYLIGGGVTLTHSQMTLRIEQQYYRTGSAYHSNQTLAKFTFLLD
ncbi:hypothetical protein [Legionella sp. W05-934-2]|uniref:hypothetical protein n=1 Tax=Legionella sp. W05-934-2 TaxID=1198649 RepID=UPI003461FD60